MSRAVDERMRLLSPAKRALFERERASMALTGHDWVARTLHEAGVGTVYGVPGIPVYATFAACARQGLRLVGARHQQAAVLMAAAHGYMQGRPAAAALVSSGPAAANALTGVLVARDNAWPLVVLAGAVPTQPRDYGYLTTLDAEELFRPLTKRAMTAGRTADIAPAIREAFTIAMTGRPGPVLVQLPMDALDGMALATPSPASRPAPPQLAPGLVDDAARVLGSARRPLLVVGKGVRWNDAHQETKALVERLALPFVTSPMARGLLPDDHPQCVNAVRWAAMAEADVVLMLGARLDWTFRHGSHIAPDATLIQVDVHAEEFGRNRTAELPVHGDALAFVREMLAREPAFAGASAERDARWCDELFRRRDDVLRLRAGEALPAGAPLPPAMLARALRRVLPADAVTVIDGNLILAECERHLAANVPLGRLTPGNSGCLGTGIPFAIAAKVAWPRRPVVAVCGDFAFGLSAMEMETAVRHRVPVVVVVANNDGNAGVRRQREMFPGGYPEGVCGFQPGLRYDELMRTFGGHAEHVSRADALEPALRRALASGVASCVNVALDPHASFPRDH